jgi:hypothetical protein
MPNGEDMIGHRTRIVGCWTVAVLAVVGPFGLASAGAAPSGATATQEADAAGTCTPVVMVVRHAEDEANPNGGADVLSAVGKQHAALYPEMFHSYLAEPHSLGVDGAEVTVCPIGKVIAIDPNPNAQNRSPSTNPYETIKPLAQSLGLPIHFTDPFGVAYSTVYNWDTPERLKTLLDNGTPTPTSTVVAWDKQGLYPSAEDLSTKSINGKKLNTYHFVPLLEALPATRDAIVGSGTGYTPQRTDFYVFALQHAGKGKFANAKAYKQQFSDDGGQTWYYRTALAPTDHPNDIKVP